MMPVLGLMLLSSCSSTQTSEVSAGYCLICATVHAKSTVSTVPEEAKEAEDEQEDEAEK